jgi:hypothetical protein
MSKRSLLAAVLSAVAVAAVGAGSALAGEVTGNGKPTGAPAHANSICVFSGQNDHPDGIPPEEGPPGRTQSFGQDVRSGGLDPSTLNPGKVGRGVPIPHPGFACNGHHGFFSGGGEE